MDAQKTLLYLAEHISMDRASLLQFRKYLSLMALKEVLISEHYNQMGYYSIMLQDQTCSPSHWIMVLSSWM